MHPKKSSNQQECTQTIASKLQATVSTKCSGCQMLSLEAKAQVIITYRYRCYAHIDIDAIHT